MQGFGWCKHATEQAINEETVQAAEETATQSMILGKLIRYLESVFIKPR
jgi:hypothetical protein